MPIYRLESSTKVSIAGRSAMQVSWLSSAAAEIRVDALVNNQPVTNVVRPHQGLLVVPASSAEVTLRVTPARGGVFGTATSIEMQMLFGQPNRPDPEIVRLPSLEISGQPFRDLAIVQTTSTGMTISAVKIHEDLDLGPAAALGRSMARTVAGVDRFAPDRQVNLAVAVDVSPSMWPQLADGTVQHVLELLMGIGQVVCPDRPLQIIGALPEVGALNTGAPRDFAQRAVELLRKGPTAAGFRASRIRREMTENTLVYVITDGVPADWSPDWDDMQLAACLPAPVWQILGRTFTGSATLVNPQVPPDAQVRSLMSHPLLRGKS